MVAVGDGGAVIAGEHEDQATVRSFENLVDHPVDLLDDLDLSAGVPVVPRDVGPLHVAENEVVVLERRNLLVGKLQR